ncbi:MAG: tetraacyldisaccharide 4'-kinase [Bacteroidales bacterium]|nr:tetraacyldisaccharide 4'-kinase [Bacteroidales bacterium]
MSVKRIHIPRRIRRLLKPLGWLFGQMVRLRRWCYHKRIFRSWRAEVPAICVGNLAVGGTGKTPHVAYILSLLQSSHHPALLSRGYGRQSKGYVFADHVSENQLSASLIGDEPLLLHSLYPDIPLAVDGDRVEGIQKLCQDAPATDVVVLDDAYQHLSLKADLNMVLTEYSWPYFVDYPLPAGRLREFPSAVRDADMVVVTKTTEAPEQIRKEEWRQKLQLAPDQPLFFTSYQYQDPLPVTTPARNLSLEDIREVILVTGIARPQPLADYLGHHFTVAQHIKYPDHHRYSAAEMDALNAEVEDHPGRVVMTTEKDWMRMQEEILKKTVSSLPVFIIPISVQFLFEDEQLLFNQIIQKLC